MRLKSFMEKRVMENWGSSSSEGGGTYGPSRMSIVSFSLSAKAMSRKGSYLLWIDSVTT